MRVADLGWPQIIAHRGAAATAPENTLEAVADAIDQGCGLVEVDVWLGADGALVLLHDADTGRTHGVDVDAAALTSAAVKRHRVDSSRLGFANWPNLETPTLSDVFARFADAPVCWLVEVKATGLSDGEVQAAGMAVVDLAHKYAVADRLVVQSFNTEGVLPAIAAGIPGGFLDTDGSTSPAVIAGQGFSFYGVRKDASPAVMADIKSQGLGLLVWTCNRHHERDAALAAGADGVVTDQPGYLRLARTPATRASLETGTWAPGHLPSPLTGAAGTFNAGGFELGETGAGSDYTADTLGQISPLATPQDFTLTCRIRLLETDTSNKSAQIQLCSTDVGYDDRHYDRTDAYNILIRENGYLDIYRIDASADTATRIARSQGASLPSTATVTVTVDVTPSTISVTRAGYGSDVVTSVSDDTFRPGYVSIGVRDARARFSDVAVA